MASERLNCTSRRMEAPLTTPKPNLWRSILLGTRFISYRVRQTALQDTVPHPRPCSCFQLHSLQPTGLRKRDSKLGPNPDAQPTPGVTPARRKKKTRKEKRKYGCKSTDTGRSMMKPFGPEKQRRIVRNVSFAKENRGWLSVVGRIGMRASRQDIVKRLC